MRKPSKLFTITVVVIILLFTTGGVIYFVNQSNTPKSEANILIPKTIEQTKTELNIEGIQIPENLTVIPEDFTEITNNSIVDDFKNYTLLKTSYLIPLKNIPTPTPLDPNIDPNITEPEPTNYISYLITKKGLIKDYVFENGLTGETTPASTIISQLKRELRNNEKITLEGDIETEGVKTGFYVIYTHPQATPETGDLYEIKAIHWNETHLMITTLNTIYPELPPNFNQLNIN